MKASRRRRGLKFAGIVGGVLLGLAGIVLPPPAQVDMEEPNRLEVTLSPDDSSMFVPIEVLLDTEKREAVQDFLEAVTESLSEEEDSELPNTGKEAGEIGPRPAGCLCFKQSDSAPPYVLVTCGTQCNARELQRCENDLPGFKCYRDQDGVPTSVLGIR